MAQYGAFDDISTCERLEISIMRGLLLKLWVVMYEAGVIHGVITQRRWLPQHIPGSPSCRIVSPAASISSA